MAVVVVLTGVAVVVLAGIVVVVLAGVAVVTLVVVAVLVGTVSLVLVGATDEVVLLVVRVEDGTVDVLALPDVVGVVDVVLDGAVPVLVVGRGTGSGLGEVVVVGAVVKPPVPAGATGGVNGRVSAIGRFQSPTRMVYPDNLVSVVTRSVDEPVW